MLFRSMDVLSVRGAVAKAAQRARVGEGPTLIEAKTYRYYGHSHSDPRAYRTREEEAFWRDRDPIKVQKSNMTTLKMLSEPEFEDLQHSVKDKLDQAMVFSEASPEPDPNDLTTDVYAPSKSTAADIETDTRLRQAIRSGSVSRVIPYAQDRKSTPLNSSHRT